MKTGYKNVFFVASDEDFDKLAHKAKGVDLILVPKSRKEEFLNSIGFKCLFPMLSVNGGLFLYYDDC